MAKRITRKERAEEKAMWAVLEGKRKELAELEKQDKKETKSKRRALKKRIFILNEEFCTKAIELLRRSK